MLSSTLRALGEGATKGPWVHDIDPRTDGADQVCTDDGRTIAFMSRGRVASDPDLADLDEDAALIVALRNNLSVLLAALELAEAVDRGEYVWSDIAAEGAIRKALSAYRESRP